MVIVITSPWREAGVLVHEPAVLSRRFAEVNIDNYSSHEVSICGDGDLFCFDPTMQTRGVLRRSLRSYTTALSSVQLRSVIEQIHVHIERDLTVAELAETAGLSAAYFSEAFRGATGYPPHQFVLRARVERAKELLRTTNWRIIEVAMACGFQSPQQLAKVFQRLLKTTPTGYRREFAR